MVNDLLVVPNYTEKRVRFVLHCRECWKYEDDTNEDDTKINKKTGKTVIIRTYEPEEKNSYSIPNHKLSYLDGTKRKMNPIANALFSYARTFVSRQIIISKNKKFSESFDAMDILHRGSKSDSSLQKFFEIKSEKFSPDTIPSHFQHYYLEVEYCEIREQILPYIEQKYGIIKLYKILNSLFAKNKDISNCKTFEEYIDKKTKHLLNLDLSSMITSMNNETKIKIQSNILFNSEVPK